jgi:CMP-N-acetylneuraminic acid synthetase|tara:strand:+ start:757 stop:1410 length:654 start_codon:yes stop_codon:yes gene_type:complete
MSNKLTAIIPVRAGSQRVKDKNIKPFAGTTLLEIKIETLKRVQGIDEIVVTSDSEKMLDIATKYNVSTHKRDEHFASNEVNNSDFMQNLSTIVEDGDIMFAPCTSPLLSSETITEIVTKYKTGNFKNIVTAISHKHHMWLDGRPLNYNPSDSPNSQDLPDIYSVNYGCCILSKEDLHKHKNVVFEPTFFLTDEIESIDIDTEFDFKVAEYIYGELNV